MDFTTRGRTVSVIFGDGAGAAGSLDASNMFKPALASYIIGIGRNGGPIGENYIITSTFQNGVITTLYHLG